MHRDHLGQRARICQLEVACSYRLRRRRLNRGVQFSHLKAIKLATSQRDWQERENRGERVESGRRGPGAKGGQLHPPYRV